MIVLGRIKIRNRCHFRHDRIAPQTGFVQRGNGLLGDGLLLRRVIEDGGTILRPDICALPVEGGGIVNGEEHVQNVLEADDVVIERDLHHFSVTGAAGAH